MAIQVKCPNEACGKVLRVRDALAGKLVKCPGCQKPIQIPKASEAKASSTDEVMETVRVPPRQRTVPTGLGADPAADADENPPGRRPLRPTTKMPKAPTKSAPPKPAPPPPAAQEDDSESEAPEEAPAPKKKEKPVSWFGRLLKRLGLRK